MNQTEQAAIDRARARRACELCGKPNTDYLEAAHALSKGMGSAHEINHDYNLLAFCRDCHQAQHTEGVTGILQRLIAKRECRPVEVIRECVRKLRNT